LPWSEHMSHHLPALAVPTISKHNFVCPPDHIRALEELIPQVSKIAIIGWRGAERRFVEMLAKGLKQKVDAIAACGNSDAAQETLGRLRTAGIAGNFQAAPGGFTDFVVTGRIEPLLAEQAI
jgi:hypothetical protein